MAFAFPTCLQASFVVREREEKWKHQQLVSGVSLTAYWASTLLWDTLVHLIPIAVAICLMFAFNLASFVGNTECIAATFLIFGLYSVAGPLYSYVNRLFIGVNRLFSRRRAAHGDNWHSTRWILI
jgi:ATP-binding cassette subfamily A (ABC1) protein 3